MIQNDMRWCWKSIIKETFSNYFCLSLIIVIDFRILFIMKRNLISLHKIIVKMNWKNLWFSYLFISFIWKLLMIYIFKRLLNVTSSLRCCSSNWFCCRLLNCSLGSLPISSLLLFIRGSHALRLSFILFLLLCNLFLLCL